MIRIVTKNSTYVFGNVGTEMILICVIGTFAGRIFRNVTLNPFSVGDILTGKVDGGMLFMSSEIVDIDYVDNDTLASLARETSAF